MVAKTSSEVKNRWNAENYKRYTVNLRRTEDADLIEFTEKFIADRSGPSRPTVTDIFRAGIEALKLEEQKQAKK